MTAPKTATMKAAGNSKAANTGSKPATSTSGADVRRFTALQRVKIDKRWIKRGASLRADLDLFNRLKERGVLKGDWNDGE